MILFGKWCAHVTDYVLGWMMLLPYDLVIILLAIGTSLILTGARWLVTNQNLMRRCKSDLARLGELKKQAKKAKDKPAVRRMATTLGMIQLTQMKAELWGTLASLLPIVFLASWAFERLDFTPPKVGEEFTVKATFPIEAKGKPTWLMIDPAGKVEPGCPLPAGSLVQLVRKDDNIDPFTAEVIPTEPGTPDNGLAEWKLKVKEPSDSIKLTICYQGKKIEHPLMVGGRQYADPILAHDANAAWPSCTSTVVMDRPLFLSSAPGMTAFWKWWVRVSNHLAPKPHGNTWRDNVVWYGWQMPVWLVSRLTCFAPWLAAYLIICIPFVPLLRRVLRVN
jgi:uncharacterized membrane protein (DUF106 family)